MAIFTIQNFGRSKVAKPEVVAKLAEIVRQYDLVAVQEISDRTEQAPRQFLSMVNASGGGYGLILSPRTGQEPEDINAQEAYAFIYRTNR